MDDFWLTGMGGIWVHNPMGVWSSPEVVFPINKSLQAKRRDAMVREILRRKWLLTYTLLILVTSLLFSVALVGIFMLSTIVQSSLYGILAVEIVVIIYLLVRMVINPEEVTYKHKKNKYWYYDYF